MQRRNKSNNLTLVKKSKCNFHNVVSHKVSYSPQILSMHHSSLQQQKFLTWRSNAYLLNQFTSNTEHYCKHHALLTVCKCCQQYNHDKLITQLYLFSLLYIELYNWRLHGKPTEDTHPFKPLQENLINGASINGKALVIEDAECQFRFISHSSLILIKLFNQLLLERKF